MQIQTILEDRILRYDGYSIVDYKGLCNAILNDLDLSKICIKKENEAYKKQFARHDIELKMEEELPNFEFNFIWNIPYKYLLLDIEEYLINKFIDNNINRSQDYKDKALKRLYLEIELFNKHNLMDLTKTVIYVLDQLTEQNIVWGVGRGSSSSSYIFYLIGLHFVDVIEYDIDITDFIK